MVALSLAMSGRGPPRLWKLSECVSDVVVPILRGFGLTRRSPDPARRALCLQSVLDVSWRRRPSLA